MGDHDVRWMDEEPPVYDPPEYAGLTDGEYREALLADPAFGGGEAAADYMVDMRRWVRQRPPEAV